LRSGAPAALYTAPQRQQQSRDNPLTNLSAYVYNFALKGANGKQMAGRALQVDVCLAVMITVRTRSALGRLLT